MAILINRIDEDRAESDESEASSAAHGFSVE